jgi:hypothetical protein
MSDALPSRRATLALIGGGIAVAAARPAFAERFVATRALKPGEFIWQPDRSPGGPLVIVVSLPEQLVHIYRGGVEIGQSNCSTGRPGHRTPTGVFTILEKQRQHVSSLYKGAQMPNMERLTWGGIALHAGSLPGYPASHGCIRLPMRFSALLYEATHLGAVVIIADERTQPTNVVHPGIMLSDVANAEARSMTEHIGRKKVHGPWEAEVHYPVTSVVISRADARAYLFNDGLLEGTYPVTFMSSGGGRIGTHAYTLIGPAADGSGLTWMGFGLGKSSTDAHIVRWDGDATMRRVIFRDRARATEIAKTFHPGTTLVITDTSSSPRTRTLPGDLTVIASEPPE